MQVLGLSTVRTGPRSPGLSLVMDDSSRQIIQIMG